MLIPFIDIANFNNYVDDFLKDKPKIRSAIMDTLNFFHLMFIDLFEKLRDDDNFVEILLVCPLTKKLAMAGCPLLYQNYESDIDIIKFASQTVQNYKNTMWPDYESNNEPLFTMFCIFEHTILMKLLEVEQYLRTIDAILLRNYIIDAFGMVKPLTYENIKDEYDKEKKSDNFSIKWCQYSAEGMGGLKFVPQLSKNKELETSIKQYFDQLFDPNTKIMKAATKPNGVSFILGDSDDSNNNDDNDENDMYEDDNDNEENEEDEDDDEMDIDINIKEYIDKRLPDKFKSMDLDLL